MENNITDMEKRIAEFAYYEKIAIPQAKELEELYKAGYDIEPALKGRIEGIYHTTKMVEFIKNGDADGIAKLIEETAKANAGLKKADDILTDMGF